MLYANLCIFLKFRLDLVRKEYQYCLNRKQHPFIAGYYQLTNSLVKTNWQSLKCLSQEKSTSSSMLVVSEPVTYLVLSLNSDSQLFHQSQQNEQPPLTSKHWPQIQTTTYADGNPGLFTIGKLDASHLSHILAASVYGVYISQLIPRLGYLLRNICATNNLEYVPYVAITILYFDDLHG